MRYYIPCKYSPGSFSGERIIEIRVLAYEDEGCMVGPGIARFPAPKHFITDRNGETPQIKKGRGLVQIVKLVEEEKEARVAVPNSLTRSKSLFTVNKKNILSI